MKNSSFNDFILILCIICREKNWAILMANFCITISLDNLAWSFSFYHNSIKRTLVFSWLQAERTKIKCHWSSLYHLLLNIWYGNLGCTRIWFQWKWKINFVYCFSQWKHILLYLLWLLNFIFSCAHRKYSIQFPTRTLKHKLQVQYLKTLAMPQ